MKQTRYQHLFLGLLLMLFSSIGLTDNSPTAQLRVSIDQVLAVLKDNSLEQQIRRERIRSIIDQRFYYRAMSQQALARNWRKANKEQQQRFVELFSKLLEKTYIGRIEAYTNERVEYIREKMKNAKRSVVYTQIVTASKEIPIDYKLALKDGQWLVYDVVIENISLISNYRTSYAEIISNEGMDGLLAKMQEKVDSGESDDPGAKTS